MKNLACMVSGTALILGSLATPASALRFLVEGSVESTGNIDILGLVEEDFDLNFGFSETIDNDDFGISDAVLASSLANGNVTVPDELLNLFLPFDFEASLGIEDLLLLDQSASLSVDTVGEFELAFNASDPNNPAFDLTPASGSDIDLSLCLTATCAISGSFLTDFGATADLGFVDTSAVIELAGIFELSSTPLLDQPPSMRPPGPAVPSEPVVAPNEPQTPPTQPSIIPEPEAPGMADTPEPIAVPEPMTLLSSTMMLIVGASLTRRR